VIVHNEHNSVFRFQQNQTIDYIPLQIPLERKPDLSVCNDLIDTLYYVCTKSYTKDEFSYMNSIIQAIHDQLTTASCILINDMDGNHSYVRGKNQLPVYEENIIYERLLPRFRKVVNGYDKRDMWINHGYDRVEYHLYYELNKHRSVKTIKEQTEQKEKEEQESRKKEQEDREEHKEKEETNKLHVVQKIPTKRKIVGVLHGRVLYNGFSLYPYDYFHDDRRYSYMLQHTWWFDYFIKGIPCSHGRIVQFENTCWFNTIINVMTLSKPIATILKRIVLYSPEYETYYKDNGNKQLFTYTNPPLVNDLIAKGVGSGMTFAKKIKFITEHPELAIPLQALCYGLLHNIIDLDEKVLLRISKILNPTDNEEYIGYYIPQMISLLLTGGFIFPDGDYIPSPFVTTLSLLRVPYEYYSCTHGDYHSFIISSIEQSIGKNSDAPLIVIDLHGCFMGITPLTRLIAGYELVAAGLLSNDGLHIISGLICEGTPYVFDSNNMIARTDWIQSDMTGYTKRIIETNMPQVFINRFACVMYVKQKDEYISNKTRKNSNHNKMRNKTNKNKDGGSRYRNKIRNKTNKNNKSSRSRYRNKIKKYKSIYQCARKRRTFNKLK